MKRIILTVAALLTLTAAASSADENVSGYYRSNGTYVQGYTRSSPDSSYNNNYGVRSNTNPYTGREGTASPTYNDRTPSYNTQTYGNPGYTNSNPYGTTTPPRSTYRGW